MRLFKLVIIFTILLFISGCGIDYTLVVTDKYFDEDISILIDNDSIDKSDINQDYNPIHYSDKIFYKKTTKKKGNKVIVNLKYRYTLDEFKNANSFNQGFLNRDVKLVDDVIYINLSDFSGFAQDIDFDIKIKTKNDVIKHNADVVNGYTYIWHVDSKNKDKLHIEMEIKKGTAKSIFEENKVYIIIGTLVFTSLIILILLFIIRKVKVNQKV